MTIKLLNSKSSEDGQALVELMFVVILCFMMGIGIYEIGSLFHNLSVMNKAMTSATKIASRGGSYDRIRALVESEAENLIGGDFLAQEVNPDPGLVIEVWNPETNKKLGTYTEGNYTYREQCSQHFSPNKSNVTPYLFWAQGYSIRVGVEYNIGVYIPFISTITIEPIIAHSRTIVAQNDLDRDGMVDSLEAAYVEYAMNEESLGIDWQSPSHRDQSGNLDTSLNIDIDGDGTTKDSDTAPFDRDNDGVEDKFDKAEDDPGDNLLLMNPLMGPGVDPDSNNNKWVNGDCPT